MFAITLLILSLGVSAYAQISSDSRSPPLPVIGGPTDKPSGPFGSLVVSKKYVDPPNRFWRPPPIFDDPIFGTTESPFGGPFGPVSKRDDKEDEDVEIETLVELLTKTIDKVQKDISSNDLAEAAQKVKDLADSIIFNTGGLVNHQDVLDLVFELGAEIDGGDVDLSILFDDPLKFEARTLWFALRVWIELTNRLVELDAAGSSADTTLAAISFTADVIQNALRNTVHLMSDMIKEVKGNPDVTKRQIVNPEASIDVSKTWNFDSGSSLKLKGTVSTSNFKNVDVSVGLSFSF